MKNMFLSIFTVLMREPRRHCRGYMIIWRKLVCVTAILATVGVFLQICVFPYPLQNWFLVPPPTTSSYYGLNSTFHLEETLPLATLEHLPSIISSNSSNGTSERILPMPEVEVRAEVPLGKGTDHMDTNRKEPDKPNVVLQPVPVVGVIDEVPHGKGRDHMDTNEKDPHKPKAVLQPVPVVEVRAEVPHEKGRDHTDTNKKEPDNPKLVLQTSPGVAVRHQSHIWSLPPDEALVYAKNELEHAPIVTNDPDLYAPLFRNVSIFKRSHELMESILKVFIYKEGKRPIFHHPHLKGIYASEGWFMKLMEENRQFVTSDPKKAHLFYLPYSSRQLELALYVPETHNIKPLAIFLRDYVNMIAAKYPFWNRTRGADHFLVACHDWGPYTVNEHEELLRNSIKALCNADLSEGIFVSGRDVSLPETTIRKPRNPLRGIGGLRVSRRPILAFFAGNMHGRVRPNLVRYWRDKDKDMRIYGPLPNRVARNMSYAVHMKSSKFCICPMGFEVNSPRIVESIYSECVPVIIADNFVLPFSDVLDWKAFSVVVAEKDIPNLKEILLAIPLRRYMSMQTNVKMLQKHFLWNPKPIRYDLFHMVLHSIWFNRLNQIQLQHQ